MNHTDPQLAALLRRALHDAADQHDPTLGVLEALTARAGARARHRRRLRVVIAVAATMSAVATVAVLPRLLPTSPTVDGGVATPTLADQRTAWPYASRGDASLQVDADLAAGRYPQLMDPATAAITFIESFVGTGVTLTATRAETTATATPSLEPVAAGWNGGDGDGADDPDTIHEVVLRHTPSGDTHAVSLVSLVRLRPEPTAPYLVVSASRPPLLDDAGSGLVVRSTDTADAATTRRLEVSGAAYRDAGGSVPRIRVELRDPSARHTLSTAVAPPAPAAQPGWNPWQVGLHLDARTPIRANTLAAWTVDDHGRVLDFVAGPV